MSKLNTKRLMWAAVNRYKNRDKIKKQKEKEAKRKAEIRAKNRANRDWKIKTFGKARYYLSWWFGQWVLFIGRRNTNVN